MEKLSFTYRYQTRDIVKNHDLTEGVTRIQEALSDGFKVATLFTTSFDLTLENGALKRKPPSHTALVPSTHDRVKKRLISTEHKAYLHALHITDDQGVVLNSAQDKYRQINKYIEILS